jgi:hypothetical protein
MFVPCPEHLLPPQRPTSFSTIVVGGGPKHDHEKQQTPRAVDRTTRAQVRLLYGLMIGLAAPNVRVHSSRKEREQPHVPGP